MTNYSIIALCILTAFAWIGIVSLIDRMIGFYFAYKMEEAANEILFTEALQDEIESMIESL